MKVIATEVKAHELEPGDLFSFVPVEQWNGPGISPSVVQIKIHLKTNKPLIADEWDIVVSKLEIIKEPYGKH